jgi:hypothetical protein
MASEGPRLCPTKQNWHTKRFNSLPIYWPKPPKYKLHPSELNPLSSLVLCPIRGAAR